MSDIFDGLSNLANDLGLGSDGSPELSPFYGPQLPPSGERPENQGSPLVLDLGSNGINLTALGDQSIYFDLRGDGQAVLTGWVAPEDGLLVRDVNVNGVIDDIFELFGNETSDGSVLTSAKILEDFQRFFADMMLDAFGVIFCCFRSDTETDQEI